MSSCRLDLARLRRSWRGDSEVSLLVGDEDGVIMTSSLLE